MFVGLTGYTEPGSHELGKVAKNNKTKIHEGLTIETLPVFHIRVEIVAIKLEPKTPNLNRNRNHCSINVPH